MTRIIPAAIKRPCVQQRLEQMMIGLDSSFSISQYLYPCLLVGPCLKLDLDDDFMVPFVLAVGLPQRIFKPLTETPTSMVEIKNPTSTYKKKNI